MDYMNYVEAAHLRRQDPVIELDNAAQVLIDQLRGDNFGKVVIQVSEPIEV